MFRKIHYGWVVCASGVLILFCTNGMTANALFMSLPFIEELGYTGTQGSILVSVRCLTSFLVMLVVNPIYERIGLRNGLTISCGTIALAYFAMGIAQGYIAYLVAASMLGVGYGIGAMIPISILISRWFSGYRATALSICSVGTGLCSLIIPPIFTNLVEMVSLPMAFYFLSIVACCVMLLTFCLIRNDPNDIGLKPVAEKIGGRIKTEIETKCRVDVPVWGSRFLTLTIVLFGGLSISSSAHYSVHFVSSGYNKLLVANMLSIFGLALIISKFFFGIIVDRIGGKRASTLYLSLMTMGCLLCCYPRFGMSCAYLGLILMGVGFPVSNVGVSIWAEDFSTEKRYPKILRDFQMAFSIGGMLISSLPGRIYDCTGSYVGAYVAFVFMLVVVTIVLLLTYRLRERQILKTKL